MNHTSGLVTNWMVLYPTMLDKDPDGNLKSFIDDYFYVGGKYYSTGNISHFAPGEKFEYSNVGVTLLAHVVEKVTSRDFKNYCNDEIFVALGMNNTSWFLTEKVKRYAVPYKSFFGLPKRHGYYSAPFYPAGFLKTTAGDLSKIGVLFLQAHSGIKNTIISTKSLNDMIKPQDGVVSDHWDKMGLILQINNVDSREIIGHTGGFYGMSSLLFTDFNSNSGALILTNGDWRSDTGYKRLNEKPMTNLLMQ